MVTTDPIADMLTRIRNANSVNQETVDVPASKLKVEIARVLKEEGYIRDYRRFDDNKQGILRLYLKYGPNKSKVITGIRRVSTPGRRVYRTRRELPRVLGGLGIALLTTSRGVMSDRKARKEGLGGEVIGYVW